MTADNLIRRLFAGINCWKQENGRAPYVAFVSLRTLEQYAEHIKATRLPITHGLTAVDRNGDLMGIIGLEAYKFDGTFITWHMRVDDDTILLGDETLREDAQAKLDEVLAAK